MIEWIVTSSALIGIVIGLRFLLKNRIRCGLRYGLWLMVLLRLLIPVSLPSAFSVMNLLPETQSVQPVEESHGVVTPDSTTKAPLPSLSKPIQPNPQPPFPQLAPQNPQQSIQGSQPLETDQQHTAEDNLTFSEDSQPTVMPKQIFTVLWVCGIAVFSFILLYANGRFIYQLCRTRTPLEFPNTRLRVYCSEVVETPCLHGIFRPTVYLPPTITDPQDVRYALTHEFTHYRHKDHIWSVLRCICLAVHWYNPLVWFAAILSRQDAELACDESVIRQLGEAHRTNYGKTLIKMACFQHNSSGLLTTSTTMLTTKKSLKERVSMIAKKPKTAIVTLICVLFIAATAAACTFTGKEKTQQSQPQQSQQPQQETVSALSFQNGEVVFVRQRGGFGSDFTITLYEDGTFKYYEGNYSSYIGYGNWKLEDDLLTLNETKLCNVFRIENNALIWLEEKSTGFIYGAHVQLTDGDCFFLQDAPPAQLGYMPYLCYLPQDYMDGGPLGCFLHVDGTTYVWDHNVIGTLQDMQAEEIGKVASCDNTKIPESHLSACRIPEGTVLYKGKDAGNSKYEAIYYKLEGYDFYARMLPADAYHGADRWWESQTMHDGKQALTVDALRKLQKEKGKLLSRADLTQYSYVAFLDNANALEYRLFQVDTDYRLLLISPATITDVEAFQARFYHKDLPLYWVDLMTTDIDFYQSNLTTNEVNQVSETEVVYEAEGFVTAESLKRGVPCKILLEKNCEGARHLNTQLVVTSPAGTIRQTISHGIGPVIPDGERLHLADLDGDRVCEIILQEDLGGNGGYGAYRCRVFKVDNNTITAIFDVDSENELNTGFYWEICDNFKFIIHNRITGDSWEIEADQYRRDYYFDGTGKVAVEDPEAFQLWADSFYEFYPRDIDGDGIYEICTTQYTWDITHVDGVGDVKCVFKYDTASGSFRIIETDFVQYTE